MRRTKFDDEVNDFFDFAEKGRKINIKKALSFKKGKVKKSFKSEGLKF